MEEKPVPGSVVNGAPEPKHDPRPDLERKKRFRSPWWSSWKRMEAQAFGVAGISLIFSVWTWRVGQSQAKKAAIQRQIQAAQGLLSQLEDVIGQEARNTNSTDSGVLEMKRRLLLDQIRDIAGNVGDQFPPEVYLGIGYEEEHDGLYADANKAFQEAVQGDKSDELARFNAQVARAQLWAIPGTGLGPTTEADSIFGRALAKLATRDDYTAVFNEIWGYCQWGAADIARGDIRSAMGRYRKAEGVAHDLFGSVRQKQLDEISGSRAAALENSKQGQAAIKLFEGYMRDLHQAGSTLGTGGVSVRPDPITGSPVAQLTYTEDDGTAIFYSGTAYLEDLTLDQRGRFSAAVLSFTWTGQSYGGWGGPSAKSPSPIHGVTTLTLKSDGTLEVEQRQAGHPVLRLVSPPA